MKQGMTLPELSEVLDFQHDNHSDFIVSTTAMRVHYSDTREAFVITFTDRSRRKARAFEYPMTRHTLVQVAQHTHVPMLLIDRMCKGTTKEQEEIGKLITVRLRENPFSRMLRTILGGKDRDTEYARAFVSDRYRTLDNYELLQAIFPILKEAKGRIKVASCSVTESRMYLKLIYSLIEGSLGKTHDDNGFEVDDIVQAGVIVSNSEVGDGPIRVQPFLSRLVCKNGATVTMKRKGQRKIHVGRQVTNDDILNDKLGTSNKEFFEKVAATVRGVIMDKQFYASVVKEFRATKTQFIEDNDAAIVLLGRMFKMTDTERLNIQSELLVGPGTKRTRFQLINAVTASAKVRKLTYDRASELEEIGGKLIEMTAAEWKVIGSAKTPTKELLTI